MLTAWQSPYAPSARTERRHLVQCSDSDFSTLPAVLDLSGPVRPSHPRVGFALQCTSNTETNGRIPVKPGKRDDSMGQKRRVSRRTSLQRDWAGGPPLWFLQRWGKRGWSAVTFFPLKNYSIAGCAQPSEALLRGLPSALHHLQLLSSPTRAGQSGTP